MGFKIWCCCCSCCGYLCTFQVYEGKPTDSSTGKQVPEKGKAKRVVLEIILTVAIFKFWVYAFILLPPSKLRLFKCKLLKWSDLCNETGPTVSKPPDNLDPTLSWLPQTSCIIIIHEVCYCYSLINLWTFI